MNGAAARWVASPNWDVRPPASTVDMLVLHYTGMRDAASAIARLRDPVAAVSAHYVVEEDGTLWQLVDEAARAYHAGVSFWRGRTGLNDSSIGVEIVNPGHEFGYRAFPEAQMHAVRDLCRGIIARHAIPARNVVAHSDIAPSRKQDPGELFDWAFLAADGVGLWPPAGEPTARPRAPLRALLAAIGYDVTQPLAVRAFQLHWLQGRPDGVADARTARRAQDVLDAMGMPTGVDADP